jgi:small subunit ribosomal protein S3
VKVILHVARPGLIIGKKGQEVELLQQELQDLIGRRVNLKIEEISRPELKAQLVAEEIAEQLSKRSSFRRTMKRALEQTMEAGAKGIKVQLAGRLGGAEMARREKQIEGSIPLSTLRADIDYGFTEAKTAQGHIGVQVWINNGMFEEDDTDGADAKTGQASKNPKKTHKR